jgi:hypothetical protein
MLNLKKAMHWRGLLEGCLELEVNSSKQAEILLLFFYIKWQLNNVKTICAHN